jgi:hypothetical protein
MAKGVVKDGRVFMRDAQGTRFSVPVADAGKELAGGARYEAPDEYQQAEVSKERGTLGQQAITAGEGALETATLGIGTAAATALGGDEYRQAAEERARENPTARVVGQVGGALAPALLSGGSGVVGSVARNTPAGLLARGSAALEGGVGGALARLGVGGEGAGVLGRAANAALRTGASGALEGAAYGLGSDLAESALEDTDWTADRALAAAGNGALFGLGAGAGIGAAGSLAASAGRKALDAMLGEGTTLKQAVDKVITRQTIKGAGADAQAIKQITRDGQAVERLQEVGQKLVERGIPADVEQAAPMLKAWQRERGAELGGIAKALDDAGVTIDVAPVKQQVDDLISSYRAKNLKSYDDIADALEREVKPFFSAQDARAGVMRRASGDLEDLAKLGLSNSKYLSAGMREGSAQKVAAEFASGAPIRPLDVTRYPDGSFALQDGRHRLQEALKLGHADLPVNLSVMDEEGNIIRQMMGNVPLKPGTTAESAAAPLSFSDMWETRTNLRKAWQLESRARGVTADARRELYDVFSQALDDGIASVASPEVGQAWKAAAQDYADASALVAASGRTARRKATAAALTGSDLGVGATAGGLLGLMTGAATGSIGIGALTQMVTSSIGSAAAKFVRARGPEILTKLAGMAAETEHGMQTIAQSLAGKGANRGAVRAIVAPHLLSDEKPKAQDYETIERTVIAAQTDPNHLPSVIAKAVEPIAREHPEVAMAMGKRMAGDMAWIASKLPQPKTRLTDSMTPLKEKPLVSDQDKLKVANYAHALSSPMTVLYSLAPGGHVNWDGIQALKERRPDLWQSMREHVIKATATAEKPLSLRRRTLLGVAFDFRSDWSLSHVKEIQAIGQQAPNVGNGKPAMTAIDTSSNALPGQPGFEESSV